MRQGVIQYLSSNQVLEERNTALTIPKCLTEDFNASVNLGNFQVIALG